MRKWENCDKTTFFHIPTKIEGKKLSSFYLSPESCNHTLSKIIAEIDSFEHKYVKEHACILDRVQIQIQPHNHNLNSQKQSGKAEPLPITKSSLCSFHIAFANSSPLIPLALFTAKPLLLRNKVLYFP